MKYFFRPNIAKSPEQNWYRQTRLGGAVRALKFEEIKTGFPSDVNYIFLLL